MSDVVIAPEGDVCPSDYVKLITVEGYTSATSQVGLTDFQGTKDALDGPGGCYYCHGVSYCTNGV
jgi:hypothetical protein